ncbi:hypothetical protein ACFYST_17490 [Kitasatospora sp. NPDC004614]|uniref:hypothetical protein n=1 Tax=unclassified Kitasatospora TaxID=2633591 RepID=UPI0036791F49
MASGSRTPLWSHVQPVTGVELVLTRKQARPETAVPAGAGSVPVMVNDPAVPAGLPGFGEPDGGKSVELTLTVGGVLSTRNEQGPESGEVRTPLEALAHQWYW